MSLGVVPKPTRFRYFRGLSCRSASNPYADLQAGLSPASFYKFEVKYGGLEASDAARLKALEDENAKLKRLLADTMLDNVVLKDLLGNN